MTAYRSTDGRAVLIMQDRDGNMLMCKILVDTISYNVEREPLFMSPDFGQGRSHIEVCGEIHEMAATAYKDDFFNPDGLPEPRNENQIVRKKPEE